MAFLSRLRLALLISMLLSILCIVGILSSWVIFEDEFGEYWIVTAALAGAFSFSALLCVNVLCRSRHQVVMWIGVCASLLAFLIWQPVAWIEWWRLGISSRQLVLAGTMSSVIAGWCAIDAMFMTFSHASVPARVAMCMTLGLAAIVGGMTVIAVMVEPWSETFWGSFAILSLLTGCGIVTSLALGAMLRVQRVGAGESISKHIKIELVCPRCSSAQSLGIGHSRCRNCGLRIEVNVEEPVCICGYQLYKLTGTTCPECGREIPEKDHWAVHSKEPEEPGIVFD